MIKEMTLVSPEAHAGFNRVCELLSRFPLTVQSSELSPEDMAAVCIRGTSVIQAESKATDSPFRSLDTMSIS